MTSQQFGFTTEREAERQALFIKDYWAARGYQVSVTIRRIQGFGHGQFRNGYAVRSNLINGLPRNFKGTANDIRTAGLV